MGGNKARGSSQDKFPEYMHSIHTLHVSPASRFACRFTAASSHAAVDIQCGSEENQIFNSKRTALHLEVRLQVIREAKPKINVHLFREIGTVLWVIALSSSL